MISPGLPMAMIFLLQILLTSFINRTLMKCGGVDGVASYAVIKYIITFIYALFDGVTGAVQPMLGIYFGEGEKENIKTTSNIGLKTILIIGISLTVILELFAPQICKILGAGEGGACQNGNNLRKDSGGVLYKRRCNCVFKFVLQMHGARDVLHDYYNSE